MRKLFLILFSVSIAPVWGLPLDDRDRFYEALGHRDLGRMENALKHWEKGRAEDVEVLVARGVYFHAKAQQGKSHPLGPPVREEVLLIHPRRWPLNPPKPYERLDPKLAQKAGHYWRRAIQLYPWRLDIYFKLAGLYGELDDFEAQNRVLGQALLYAEKHRHDLKGENNADLPHPYGSWASQALGEFIEGYFAQHRREENVKAFRLSRLFTTFFPANPYGYNYIAVYFSTQPDWPYTLKYLMLAYQKDPRDSLVLDNIGNTLSKLGKKKEARVFYRKVVSLGQDEELVKLAKDQLD